jgi:hypothetical protein
MMISMLKKRIKQISPGLLFFSFLCIFSCSESESGISTCPELVYFEISALLERDETIAFSVDRNHRYAKSGYLSATSFGVFPDSSMKRLNHLLCEIELDSLNAFEEINCLDCNVFAMILVFKERADTLFIRRHTPFSGDALKLINEVQGWEFKSDSSVSSSPVDWKTWQWVMPPPPPPKGIKQIQFRAL